MIVLVSGSRDWVDSRMIHGRLDALEAEHPRDLIVIEGHAKGADRIAWLWATKARARGVGVVPFPAEWKHHAEGWCPGVWCALKNFCVGAGSRRNQAMIDWLLLSDDDKLVLAFKDGFDLSKGTGGTEDCVRRAKAAGIPGVVYGHTAA